MQLYSMLKDMKMTGLHYCDSFCQSSNKCSLNTLKQHSPSPQLFATGAKLLQKGAKVKIFPCETTTSISSQFTEVSVRLKDILLLNSTSSLAPQRSASMLRGLFMHISFTCCLSNVTDHCYHLNTILAHTPDMSQKEKKTDVNLRSK